MKYILFTLIVTLAMAVSSCGQDEVGLPSDDTLTDTTVSETTNEATTVTETSESANTPETTAEYTDDELQNIVDQSLETLTQSTTGLFTTEELIAAHPDAFEAIVSLGKRAIPFLGKYTDTDREMTSKEADLCVVARAAAYAIDPSLYDLVFESPDGKARLKFTVRTLNGQNWLHPDEGMTYDISLITSGIDEPLSDKCYEKAEVSWNDNSSYALLCCKQKNRRFPAVGLLVDIVGGRLIELPSFEVYNRLIKEEPDIAPFFAFSASKCEFMSDRRIKVDFELSTGASFYPRKISGYYIWDMDRRVMTYCAFASDETRRAEALLTDEEIFEIVDKNLNTIVRSGKVLFDSQLFSIYPDEVAEIVSFGKSALGALESIIKHDTTYYTNTEANIPKGLIAKIIAYIIDPSLYDLVIESPDSSVRLRFGVESFTCMLYRQSMTTSYDQIDIISSEDNSLISAFDTDPNYGSYTDISVSWSEDGAYAAVSFCNDVYDGYTVIINISEHEVIALPSIRESILPTAGIVIPYVAAPFTLSYSLDEWLDDGCVRIKYYYKSPENLSSAYEGDYLFDLESRTFSDVKVELLSYDTDASDIPETTADTNDNIQPESDVQPIIFPNGERILSVNDDLYLTNTDIYVSRSDGADVNIKASYPVLHMTDASASELINQQIRDYIDENYSYYYTDTQLVANDTLSSTTQYEITLFDENTLSIHFYGSFCGFGIPAYVEDHAFTFDLKTGNQIAISALYSDKQIEQFISTYFDEFDESAYPTLMSSYDKETIRGDFIEKFNPENDDSSAFYNSYYISYDKLYLIAGWYPDYASDINAPVSGRRAFILEAETQTTAGIKAIIDENLDILASDPYSTKSEREIIDEHPEAFEKIVALGDAALPYLKEIGKEYKYIGGDTSGNLRCFMAMAAAYAIDPDAYDRVYPSPDGQFAIKATVSSFERLADPFAGIEYNLTLIKTETGEALATSDTAYCFSEIQWSPDSKYASFADSYRHLYTYLHIFDTGNSIFYALPNERELEDFLGVKLEIIDEGDHSYYYQNLHCYIEEWENDSVKVQITLQGPAGGEKIVGWYLYDLAARKIASAKVNL